MNTENNKKIAEFMNSDSLPHRYDSSWDWLMPVWQQISKQGYEVHGHYWTQTIGRDAIVIKNFLDVDINVPVMYGEITIEVVYKAVVLFVEWYNTHVFEN